MNKSFFEVFPTLKVNEDIQLLFQGVEVAKVATNTRRDFIKVHIVSTHLIQKQRIYEIEKMLKEQLFGKNYIQVQLVEQYDLSAQYTPENLMNEYLDSIYLELGNRSVVERSMMQGASYSFEDENILCLRLTDTIVAEGKKEALSSYLETIFAERFRRPIEVRILYEAAKDSKLKYNDMKHKQEVQRSWSRRSNAGGKRSLGEARG